jgi:hypothetical protein
MRFLFFDHIFASFRFSFLYTYIQHTYAVNGRNKKKERRAIAWPERIPPLHRRPG